MSKRLSESERRHKYSYYVSNSPLKNHKMTSLFVKDGKKENNRANHQVYENMKRERCLSTSISHQNSQFLGTKYCRPTLLCSTAVWTHNIIYPAKIVQ